MVKFYKITDKHGNERLCVKVSDIKQAPENVKMYPAIPEHIDNLSDLMEIEMEFSGVPNHEALEVCPNTGYVWRGNTRTFCGQGITKQDGTVGEGYEYLYAQKSPKHYDKMTAQERADYIQNANIDGKRDEKDVRVIVNIFKFLANLFEEDNIDNKKFQRSEIYEQFVESRGIQKPKLRKLLDIDKKLPELLDEIQKGKLSIEKAYKQACGMVTINVIPDPDRFNFLIHLDETPKFKDFITDNIKKALTHFINIPLGLDKELLVNTGQYGFEKNQITAVFSNIINSVAARAYSVFGIDAKTGREYQTTDHSKSRPDIVFPALSKPDKEFQNEKIEVKAASWNGISSKCLFYGGPGAKTCSQHEYLFGIWKKDCERLFLMLATIDPEDWEATGKTTGEYTLSLNKWYENHFNKNDYRFLMGEIYMDAKRINVDFDKL